MGATLAFNGLTAVSRRVQFPDSVLQTSYYENSQELNCAGVSIKKVPGCMLATILTEYPLKTLFA